MLLQINFTVFFTVLILFRNHISFTDSLWNNIELMRSRLECYRGCKEIIFLTVFINGDKKSVLFLHSMMSVPMKKHFKLYIIFFWKKRIENSPFLPTLQLKMTLLGQEDITDLE